MSILTACMSVRYIMSDVHRSQKKEEKGEEEEGGRGRGGRGEKDREVNDEEMEEEMSDVLGLKLHTVMCLQVHTENQMRSYSIILKNCVLKYFWNTKIFS